MSWIDTLDRLITDSWMASRDESAAMLDTLLALSLAERWGLFQTRDPRLMFLADADYQVLFYSLNAHALMADAADRSSGVGPVTEEATSVLPEERFFEGDSGTTDAEAHHFHDHGYEHTHDHTDDAGTDADAAPSLRRWWQTRTGIRWLTLAITAATALVLVGALMSALVLTLFGGSLSGTGTGTLAGKLDDLERDQAHFAKRLVQVDSQLSDLATTVDNRFATAMGTVKLIAAMDQLQTAVDRGLPFATELDRVAPAVSGNAALTVLMSRLDGYAAAGVPSLSTLHDRFDVMVPQLTASETGPVGQWVDWLGSGFGLIESRESRHFHGVLASIGAALRLGTLSAAVQQLQDLHPYPTGAVDPWLAAARIRLETDAALDAVRQAVLSNPTVAPEK